MAYLSVQTPYMEDPDAPEPPFVPPTAWHLANQGYPRSQEPMSPSPRSGRVKKASRDYAGNHLTRHTLDSSTRKFDLTRSDFPDNRRPSATACWSPDHKSPKTGQSAHKHEIPVYSDMPLEKVYVPDSTKGVAPQAGYVTGFTKLHPLRELGRDTVARGFERKGEKKRPKSAHAAYGGSRRGLPDNVEEAEADRPARAQVTNGVPPQHGYVTGYSKAPFFRPRPQSADACKLKARRVLSGLEKKLITEMRSLRSHVEGRKRAESASLPRRKTRRSSEKKTSIGGEPCSKKLQTVVETGLPMKKKKPSSKDDQFVLVDVAFKKPSERGSIQSKSTSASARSEASGSRTKSVGGETCSSYESHGPIVYSDENLPLWDKYRFMLSNPYMANAGLLRAPRDGVRTCGENM